MILLFNNFSFLKVNKLNLGYTVEEINIKNSMKLDFQKIGSKISNKTIFNLLNGYKPSTCKAINYKPYQYTDKILEELSIFESENPDLIEDFPPVFVLLYVRRINSSDFEINL